VQPATASLVAPPADTSTGTKSIPWHCLVAVLGVSCIPIGVLWDISWHESIGRDTFWTPAHIVIQLGGLVPGLTCGWLALRTTFFGTVAERSTAVRLWGARAPLGAWICIWGCFAMLTSAPFDDWWHNTYGLDVKILSPPHTLLAIGMFSVALGTLLLVLSWQNGAAPAQRKGIARLFVLMAGIMTAMNSAIVMEYSFPNAQHAMTFYLVVCGHYPWLLVMAARAASLPWGATVAAGVYLAFYSLAIWVLPLFSAQPMLAPIYNPVTHMVVPPFPLLLVVPAFVIDLLMGREKRLLAQEPRPAIPWWRDWLLALALGAAFLGLVLAVQWPFARFLLTSSADNWFFGREINRWSYSANPGPWMTSFRHLDSDPLTWRGLAFALGLACIGSRAGLWLGNWMLKVRR